jgi:hypothetical protein
MSLASVNLDEYVSEIIKCFKENDVPLDKKSVAAEIMDTLYSQGVFGDDPSEGELDLAEKQIMDNLPYYAPELR